MDGAIGAISPATAAGGAIGRATPLVDILNALARQAKLLEDQADRLAAQGDYSAEFPGEDARLLREAADLLAQVRVALRA